MDGTAGAAELLHDNLVGRFVGFSVIDDEKLFAYQRLDVGIDVQVQNIE